MRWLLLLSICMVVVGYGINRYLLIPLQDQLINYYNITDIDYNLTTSLYSWPNAISLILSGIIIDKIGLNRILFSSWIITMFGSALITLSATPSSISFIMLCIGRLIVGIGNESLCLSIKVFIINSFDKREHGLAMSVYAAAVTSAQALNNVALYQIYLLFDSMQFALAVPLILYPVLSLPLFIFIIYSNTNNNNNNSNKNKQNKESESTQLITPTATKIKIIRKTTIDFNVSALKQLCWTYWVLVIVGCLFCINYTSFTNIRVSFLHHMYGYNYSLSTILSITYNVSMLLFLPICGVITDKYGIKCRLLFVATISLGIAHYLFGWIHINIVITVFTLILLGISVAIFFSVFLPSFPILVNNNIIGTAYGIYESLRFVSMGIGFIIVGTLTKEQDGNSKYIEVQYFEVIVSMVTFVFVCILWKLDSMNGYNLYKPTRQTLLSTDLEEIANKNDLTEPTEIELDFTMSFNCNDSQT